MAAAAPRHRPLLGLLLLQVLLVGAIAAPTSGIRVDVIRLPSSLPAFRNGDECPAGGRVDVAMTLDANYLRGTVVAVFSILQHTACPESVAFHFLVARRGGDGDDHTDPLAAIRATFPYLDPRVYHFDPSRVRGRISRSVRHALDQLLNYACISLPYSREIGST